MNEAAPDRRSIEEVEGRSRDRTLFSWLEKEPFTLALSSGFFGFFAHTGFVSAIFERGLRPSALTGSSAGALVAGVLAAGVDPADLRAELTAVRRDEFWDPGIGFGLLKGRAFDRILRRMVGDKRIEDCTIPIQLSAFDVASRKTRVMREGDLATAIRASCAFPGLFQPVRIEGRRCLDGGILDRAALEFVPEGTRTLHHHLSSKSPWRRALPETVAAPKRRNQVTIVIHNLPRGGPLRLDRGREAMVAAHGFATRLLDRDAEEGVLEIS